jgi:hypothetical protein
MRHDNVYLGSTKYLNFLDDQTTVEPQESEQRLMWIYIQYHKKKISASEHYKFNLMILLPFSEN